MELILQRRIKDFIKSHAVLFLIKAKVFKKLKTLFPPRTLAYIMSKTESVDVDDKEDLEYVSFLMNKHKLR